MKLSKLWFILTVLHLNVSGADYPRPLYSYKKTPADFSKLPQALLSDGQPVDPFCVGKVLMQKTGTGLALNECVASAKDVQSYRMYPDKAEEKIIGADAKIDNHVKDYIESETCEAQYEVKGVLGNKAIVKAYYNCKEGRQSTLGIVEQKNNLLINVAVLAQGDKCRFGYTYVKSLERGILHYEVMSPALPLLTTILNHSSKDQTNPLKPDYLDESDCFGWVRLTVDLNNIEVSFKPEVTSVRFKRDRPISLGDPETITKRCLLKTIEQSITDTDASIPADKFSAFRAEVNQCIGPQVPAPKPEENKPSAPGVSI